MFFINGLNFFFCFRFKNLAWSHPLVRKLCLTTLPNGMRCPNESYAELNWELTGSSKPNSSAYGTNPKAAIRRWSINCKPAPNWLEREMILKPWSSNGLWGATKFIKVMISTFCRYLLIKTRSLWLMSCITFELLSIFICSLSCRLNTKHNWLSPSHLPPTRGHLWPPEDWEVGVTIN